MSHIFQPTTTKSSGDVMTEPSDKKTCIKIDGSSDHPNADPTVKHDHWDDFFDKDSQNQVGEDFSRGDQEPAPDRNVDWDAVFGTRDNADHSGS